MKQHLFAKFFSALLIVMLAFATLPVSPARAATITVNTTVDEDTVVGTNCSLREAIIAANTDVAYNDCTAGAGSDTIVLTSGSTYALALVGAGQGDLDVTSNITITTSAAGIAIIDPTTPAFNERVFDVSAAGNLTLDTIRVTTASTASDGAAIFNAGTLTIQDGSEITSNSSTGGGGGSNGGGINSTGTLTITNTTFTSNSATNNGGAIYINGGTATITSSTFNTQNAAVIDDGAAIYLNNGTLSINNSTFTNNDTSNGFGGAIYQDDGTLNIGITTGNTFTNNDANDTVGMGEEGAGGAIYKTGGNMTIGAVGVTNTFNTNTTDGSGGAIYVDATGTYSITNATFTSNSSANEGGAIHNNGETATITSSTFSSNSSTGDRGGAISNDGGGSNLTIITNTLNGNTSAGGEGGGAIYNSGTMSITGSTLNANSVSGTLDGGAIYNENGNLTIQNNTFYGNQTTTTAGSLGGAIYSDGGTLNISFVSFSDNRASAGNGSDIHTVDNGGTDTLNVFRSFLVNPINSTINCFSNFDTENTTNSLIEGNAAAGNSCGTVASTAFASTFTLANNGGTTQTLAITPAMTSIFNAATVCTNSAGTTVTTDQRGISRPQGTNCDLGAFELVNTAPTGTDNTITINEDSTHTFAAVNFGFNDVDAADSMSAVRIDTLSIPAGATLQLSAVNVTAGQVILTASIPNLVFTPAANANGTGYASFTFSVRDTNGPTFDTSPNTMTFDVTAVNDIPSFTASTPPAVNEDAGAQTLAGWATFSAGPANESGQTVTQYIISGNTCGSLLSVGPAVDTTGQLTYTPATNENGTCTFDVAVQDNGGGTNTSPTQNFTITVNAVNDEPSFTATNPAAVNEDAGLQTVSGWVTAFNPGPANESGQTVSAYNVTIGTCGTLLAGTASVNTSGDLSYTPAANQNGTCTFDVAVQDNGGTAFSGDDTSPTQTFTITVNAINDEPTFTASNPPAVYEDAGAQSIVNWAVPDFGPADEDSSQAVVGYTVSNSTCGTLLSVAPAVGTSGTLTYTPATDQDGTCAFDVTLQDNGGTVNVGDDDTSQPQTFTITVTAQTGLTANITANNKVYNGDNTATFTCTLTGVTPPDVVTCTGGTATFADKNVGTNKLVTATGLSITGADAFKYELSSTSATDNADITQRDLNATATGINKVYDGNTTATVTLNDDRVGGDVLTLSYTSASFADPNVGTGILVTVNGISISGGADAGNYNLVNTTTTTNADITIASQTITVTTSAPASAANGSTFDVVANATSGLDVTISTTTPLICTGGDTDGTATITMISGTGTCSVIYNQAGNSNYTAAPQVQEDVTATESPAFTSANNTSFDLGFVSTFNISATGNPLTMTISLTGTLPTGVTFTDNGNGTAEFSGTPAAGTAGIYNLVLTADNGVLPNGTQNFTLTVRNGPVVGLVNSNPDTGNGSISENESIINTLNITQLIVVFDRNVYDPAGDTDPDDVTNPTNYILARSATGTFATIDCAGGVIAPDVAIAVDSVTYNNTTFTATLNINGGLPLNVAGFYRLYVCGTTSIVDATNPLLTLAGNGVTPGTDFTRNFRITAPTAGGGGGNNSGSGTSTNLSGILIPVTGFTPNQITKLPAQSAENAYTTSTLRLEIPSLSMDLPIVGIPLKDKKFDVTWLGNNAGYLEGSAYPTWQGNSILTGHVTDANGKPGAFAYVNELKTGDQIYIHNNGFIYVYEVRQSKLILPNQINDLFKSEEDYWLTLVTCENYNAKTETFSNRRIVRAVLISIIPAE